MIAKNTDNTIKTIRKIEQDKNRKHINKRLKSIGDITN